MQCFSELIKTKELFIGSEFTPIIDSYEWAITIPANLSTIPTANMGELLTFYYMVIRNIKSNTTTQWITEVFGDKLPTLADLFKGEAADQLNNLMNSEKGETFAKELRELINLKLEDHTFTELLREKYYHKMSDGDFLELTQKYRNENSDNLIVSLEALSQIFKISYEIHTTHDGKLQQMNFAMKDSPIKITMYYQTSSKRMYLLAKDKDEIYMQK